MKVFAITKAYPPHTATGAWIATHLLLRHLASLGHDVTVYVRGSRDPAYTVDGVSVVTRGGGIPSDVDADVVVSSCGDRGDIVADLSHGHPHVRLAHGWGTEHGLKADLVVFNSHSWQTAHPCTRSIVCRPPVDRSHTVDRRGEEVTIVNCSRPKGIKTAWRIADASPRRRFLGVRGWGQQVEPRVPNWMTLPSQRDMRTVWGRTRVLLMPSERETWGMAGVEAMCSGIPVIAHPTPGLCESLGDAGIFCDRDDTSAWLDALERLDDPDEYALASKKARARVDELDATDDLDRFAEAVEALCRS